MDQRTKSKKESNQLYKKMRRAAKKSGTDFTGIMKETRKFLKTMNESAKKLAEPTASQLIRAEKEVALAMLEEKV